MANYGNLKLSINSFNWDNNNNLIEGPDVKNFLLALIDALGSGYQFGGVVSPSSQAPITDANMFYLGTSKGIYSNFGLTMVGTGEIGVFAYNGTWTCNVVSVISLVNNLTTGGDDKALSAEQGKILFENLVPLLNFSLANTTTTISSTPSATVDFFNGDVTPIKAGNKILIKFTDANNILNMTGLYYRINNGSPVAITNLETIVTLGEDLTSLRVYCASSGFRSGVYGNINLDVHVYSQLSELKDVLETQITGEIARATAKENRLQQNIENIGGFPIELTGSLSSASDYNAINILAPGKKYRIFFTDWDASQISASYITFAIQVDGSNFERVNGGEDLSGTYIDVQIPASLQTLVFRYRIDSGTITIFEYTDLFKTVQENKETLAGEVAQIEQLNNEVFTRVDALHLPIFITSALRIRSNAGDSSYIRAVHQGDVVYLKAREDSAAAYNLYTLVQSYSLSEGTIVLMTGETGRRNYFIYGTTITIPEDGYIIVTSSVPSYPNQNNPLEFDLNEVSLISYGLNDRVTMLEDDEHGLVEVDLKFSDNDMFDLESYWKLYVDYLNRTYLEQEVDALNAFITKFRARAGMGKIQIAVISDTHGVGAYSYYANNNLNYLTCLRSIAAFNTIVGYCDAGIHGGDIACDYGTSRRRDLAYMRTLLRQFRFDKPFFITKGNHDENNNRYVEADLLNLNWNDNTYYKRVLDNFTIVTPETWAGDDLYLRKQELVSDNEFSNFVQHWLAPNNAVWGEGAYYYYDIDSVKIRFIVANSFPVNDDYVVSEDEEYLWLAQTAFNLSAKANPTNWKVIMLRHTQSTSLTALSDCINALRNGTSWTYGTTTVNFGTMNGGGIEFMAHIHGHEHKYCFSNGAGYFDIGETSSYIPAAQLGNLSKYGISVLTIDVTNKKIYEDTVAGNTWVYNFNSGRLEIKRGDTFECAKSGLSSPTASCSEPTITIDGMNVTIGNDTPYGNYTIVVSDGTNSYNYLIAVVEGTNDNPSTIDTYVVPNVSGFASQIDVKEIYDYIRALATANNLTLPQ